MEGKSIILYSAEKENLEKQGKWLTERLRRKGIPVTHISNHKSTAFGRNADKKCLEHLNHGIWVVVEDYSLFKTEQIDENLTGSLEILLDGNKENQLESHRLTLLELAFKNKWHVVSTNEETHIIHQHIWDCVETLKP